MKEQLEEKYLKAKIAYYEGCPIMSDYEFDILENELKNYGSKVIEQVGSKRKDYNFKHPTKMLSLYKIQTENIDGVTNYMFDAFLKWYNKRKNIIGVTTSLISLPKLDGNAINIIYRGGKLTNVLTRGDGFTGKDVTKRFEPYLKLQLDPNFSLTQNDILEVRCEVVIKTELFNNKYLGTRQEGKFANPRNYVAGVIGSDDEDKEKISELDIMPLQFILNGKNILPYSILKNETKIDFSYKIFDINEYVDIIKYYEDLRKNYEYQLDGVVISFPIEYRDLLGVNSHDPEWAVAIKYVSDEAITTVTYLEWNVSKSGELAPVFLLNPVQLAGTTVMRASAYNAGHIVDNNIGIGATVSLQKAGDIIPEVKNVIIESDKVILPITCPACLSQTKFDGIHLMCTNNKCKGKIAKQLAGAIKILELKGIGEKLIEPFAEDFENMFDLISYIRTGGDIQKYGFKENSKSSDNFINTFMNIKSLTYSQVIQMLGYENVGEKISIQLAKEHAGLEYDYSNLEKALVIKLRSAEVSDYIKYVVSSLEKLGIKIDKPKQENNMNTIYVCMTGSPKEFGYKTKEEFISQFDGVVEVSISDKKCSYLITDSYESNSSKMQTANKKGITIKTYGDFKI